MNNSRPSASTTLIDRPLPSDHEMEQAVLGAILLEKPAFGKVRDVLDDKDFDKEPYSLVYKACMELFTAGSPIDQLTVTSQLRKNNQLEAAGGPYGITMLTANISSAANIESHAAILKELSIRRKLIHTAGRMTGKAFDEQQDAFEILEQLLGELKEITKLQGAARTVPIVEHLMEAVQELESVLKGDKQAGGMPTGFLNLDKVIGGWVATNLIILAARPGMGKSSLALRLAVNQAEMFKVPAALFSLEMSNPELINRLLSMVSHIVLSAVRFRKVEDWQYKQIIDASGKLSDLPLWLVDDCFTLSQIRSKARRLVDEDDVRFIVIDYLQLIHAGRIENRRSTSRENEISYISRELKMLAKELKVPVIALSQLSRAVEQRGGDKRPKLSDLRESGAIEQDADVVMFLFRPEYYGIKQDHNGDLLPEGYSECIIAKNRNGALEMAEMIFHGYRTDFSNYDRHSLESKLGTI